MKLIVNGAERQTEAHDVLALLAALGIDPRTIVVERNGTVLRREQLGTEPLCDGDRLELVRFVGGG
jgi:thiamine biosynthesis protein ThiS